MRMLELQSQDFVCEVSVRVPPIRGWWESSRTETSRCRFDFVIVADPSTST